MRTWLPRGRNLLLAVALALTTLASGTLIVPLAHAATPTVTPLYVPCSRLAAPITHLGPTINPVQGSNDIAQPWIKVCLTDILSVLHS